MLGIEAHLKKAQLQWCGHVACMEDYHLPKQLLFTEVSQGKRHMGGQKKWYKDALNAIAENLLCTNRQVAECCSKSCILAGATINKGTTVFKRGLLQSLDEKRMAKKIRVINPRSFATCHECGKLCASQFGLRAHMRIHRHWPSSPTTKGPLLTRKDRKTSCF